jgi:hypothetical protein
MNVKVSEKHIILGVVGAAFLIMLLTASVCVMAGNDVPQDYFSFMKELATFFLGGSAIALFANGAKNGWNKLNGNGTPAPPPAVGSGPPPPG